MSFWQFWKWNRKVKNRSETIENVSENSNIENLKVTNGIRIITTIRGDDKIEKAKRSMNKYFEPKKDKI